MGVLKGFYRFLRDLYNNKSLLITLAKNDFREQYLGSHLGMLWAILRPSIFMLTVWFIFSVGFKRHVANEEIPFVLYLMCGYIPWFFFSDAVSGGMNSIVNNKFLVKKVNFRVSILPLVKVISSLYIHLVFVLILLAIFLFYGFYMK